MTGIAYQYALAVFSLAKEADRAEEFFDVLEGYSKSMDDASMKFFMHPKISKSEKQEVLSKITNDVLLLNVLKVLVDNDRFLLIKAISLAYKDILDEIHKIMIVKVVSNKALTKTNLDKIKKKLKLNYDRNIQIEEIIDDSIIGGFRIEFEGNVIDETINKQLEDIKSSLTE